MKVKFFSKQSSEPSSSDIAVDVLSKTINIFTSNTEKSFEDVITNGIFPIANAIGLDRVDIYSRLKTNRELFGMLYRWVKAEGGIIPIDDYFKVLPSIPVVDRWFDISSKGEYVIRRIDKAPKDEADFLNSVGIKSVALVPIFTSGELWGVVVFQDLNKERDLNNYINLLHSVANLFANATITEEMRQENSKIIKKLKNRERMLETLNEAAITFVSQNEESFEKRMTHGVGSICNMVNVDRFSIWRNFSISEKLHASQVYRWDKDSGGTTKPTPGLEDVTYDNLAPRWEKLLPNNEIINGPIKSMPEVSMLNSFGIVSALVVPLFVKDSFWGFALFEDRHNERYFIYDQVRIMRSAAFLCTNVIIRNEMENEIAETVKLNNTLLNSAPIAISICDENANFLDCNTTTSKVFECTKEYFLKNFYNLSPEYQPDGLKTKDKIDNILKKASIDEHKAFDWMHKSFTGDLIPCEVTLAWTNYKNKMIGLCYIYDKRNIKRMEAIAGEAQEMTRSITEASPISYILFNEKFEVIDCNEATMQLFGCSNKKFLIDNYKKFMPELQSDGQNSDEKAKIVLNKALEGGKFSFEWEHRAINGELIPVENTLAPIIFKNKKFVLSFKYDLRNYKKMITNIREQSEILASRLEQQRLVSDISKNFVSSGDSYMLIDEALDKLGKHLSVSRMFIFRMDYENTGFSLAHQWYANSSVPKFWRNEDFDFFKFIKNFFPENLPQGIIAPTILCEDVNSDKNEKFRQMASIDIKSFIYAPLYSEGNLWGIISAENCSAPHEWQRDEISFFAMVSSIIAGAIMRNIYDTKLKETLDKVTNLSKTKDEFLSKVSHEIRTPMNAILGITEIQLQDETLPQKAKENLGIIYNSGDSLLRIINDLLDLSKIEAGKLEIIIARYEIASLINDIAQLNITRIESKPIEFKLKLDESLPAELLGDELRIKQILNNVLSNAFKYTDSGEIAMSVLAEYSKDKSSNDVTLVFIVKDTGHGMTEEQTEKIFNKYSRLDSKYNHLIEGTGLGMNITRNLVNLMNGEIFVESKLNKGSSFTVRLPQTIATKEVLSKEMAKNLQSFRISSMSQMKKMKIVREPMPYGSILIVDDVESNLYVAKQLLIPYDLSIETSNNGFDAIEKVKNGKIYDIIFMDHMMPKMDGIETVKIIRSLGYEHPIIALTANAVAGQADIFLQNGFDAFISKPIDTFQMNMELNKFIRDKQSSETIAKAKEQKKEDKKHEQVAQKADAALYSIFAADAKKVLPIFESTIKDIENNLNIDFHLFAVSTHAMKGALANIGEMELSQMAFVLEMAGKEQKTNVILNRTQEFIDLLKELVKEIDKKTSRKSSKKDEDPAYLRKQLKIISDACENYEEKTANIALSNLEHISLTKETRSLLDEIAELILHSDFEKAGLLANNYAKKMG